MYWSMHVLWGVGIGGRPYFGFLVVFWAEDPQSLAVRLLGGVILVTEDVGTEGDQRWRVLRHCSTLIIVPWPFEHCLLNNINMYR